MTPTNTINGRNFAKCEIFNFHVAKSRSSKCINQSGRRIVGNRGVINRNEATFDDDEVVFHRADNRALIGPGSGFRQEFGASEISENLWRSHEFREQVEKRLNEGGWRGSRAIGCAFYTSGWDGARQFPVAQLRGLPRSFEDQTLSIVAQ